jgi:hypothetical protein
MYFFSWKRNHVAPFRIASFAHSGTSLWSRHAGAIFFAMFAFVCLSGAFFWYDSLYAFRWSDERKQEYLYRQSERATFRADDFETALRLLDERERMYREKRSLTENIFATDAHRAKERKESR